MTTTEQKEREKKRTVKNALVNLENVTIEPGMKYVNWLPLIKSKLKEREIKLMKIRLELCQTSIISSISHFKSENADFFVGKQHNPPVHIQVNRMHSDNYKAYENVIDKTISTIINTFTESITQQLTIWKGYKPGPNVERKIKTFKDYFKCSRGWFDVHKTDIIAKDILIPLSYMINQFVQKAAAEFFSNVVFRLQKLYATYLYTLILINLVEQTMKLPNTRRLFLFPAQCYAMVEIKDEIQYKCRQKQLIYVPRKTRASFKNIRNDILRALKQQYEISKLVFQSELLSLHCEVDNYKDEQTPQNNVVMHNNNNNNNKYASIPYAIDVEEPIFNQSNYKNYHNIDYKSKAIRYHPFNMCSICGHMI